jgi:hypothetical protein
LGFFGHGLRGGGKALTGWGWANVGKKESWCVEFHPFLRAFETSMFSFHRFRLLQIKSMNISLFSILKMLFFYEFADDRNSIKKQYGKS